MKSFSDNLPDVATLASKADLDALKPELRTVRNWVFGLAVLNVVLTLLLSFAIIDRTAKFAEQTRSRLTAIEQIK